MPLELGTTDIGTLKLGSTDVTKAYLDTDIVFNPGGFPAGNYVLYNFDTDFSDSSPNNLTGVATGATTINGAKKVFGAASANVNSLSGAYLSIPDNTSVFNYGTGEFVWDLWIEAESAWPDISSILTCGPNGSEIFEFLYDNSGFDYKFRLRLPSQSQEVVWNYGSPLSTFTFYHVKVTRDSVGAFRFFFAGTEVSSESDNTNGSTTVDCGANDVIMGNHPTDGGFRGYMDELRMVKGHSDTTTGVPSAAYTPSTVIPA